MGSMFKAVKWLVFALNLVCLTLGICAICVNAIGAGGARPGTDTHTFYILAILLCSLLCLTAVIGCYGVLCEVFGLNVIYSIFMLSLLIIQYLQIRSFRPHELYFNNLQDLESAWRLVETQPNHMDAIQSEFHCCGLFNAHDYSYKHLSISGSCYAPTIDDEASSSIHQVNQVGCLEAVWGFYNNALHRLVLFNWAVFTTEFITFVYSIILSFLILKRHFGTHFESINRPIITREFARQNHLDATHHPLSN